MLFPDFSMTFHNTAFPQSTGTSSSSGNIKRRGKDKELEFGFAVIVNVTDESLTILKGFMLNLLSPIFPFHIPLY
jgi:hypothetical protein